MNIAKWSVVPVVAFLIALPLGLPARAASARQSVGEKTEDGAKKVGNAVVKGTKVAAGKTKDGLSKTGEVMTDGWITTRVSSRFVNEDLLKGSNINVDTDNHVVTLNGTVTTKAGRARAGSIAKQTEGVRRMVNHLTVGAKS
jgi:osmotically-inducible protein OsmY